MDIYEIEAQWDSLLARAGDGLPLEAYVAGADQLVEQLAAIQSPEAKELALRIRLHALMFRMDADALGALAELGHLVKAYESDRSTFPLHPFLPAGQNPPVDDEGNVHRNWLLDAVDPLIYQVALDEHSTLVDSDALLQLAERITDDDDLLRHFKIATLQTNNEAHAVLPLLVGYVPSVDAVEEGVMRPAEWLDRYDKAAMAYLETGLLNQASDLANRMVLANVMTGNQPMATVAEMLRPLAHHDEYGISVDRARFVQILAVADSAQTTAMIQTATFLMEGGMAEQALSLVAYTEPFIEQTDREIADLYSFFQAATEKGYGERPMIRYGSPRWQLEHGVPADATCAKLAQRFGELALAQAQKRDARNGNTYMTDLLHKRYEVPELNSEDFDGTAANAVPPLPQQQTLRFDPVNTHYDEELVAFAREMLTPGVDDAPFPSYANAHGNIQALQEELRTTESIERAKEIFAEYVEIANDTTVDPRVRTTLDLFIQANFCPPFAFAAEAAARALPMLANLNAERTALKAAIVLQVLGSQDQLDSPLALELFEFVMALVSTTSVDHEVLIQLALMAEKTGRYMDAIACIDKARAARAMNPTVVEDAESFDANFQAMRGSALGQLGAHLAGSKLLLDAGNTAEKLGDANESLLRGAAALDTLLDGGIFAPAESVARDLAAILDDGGEFYESVFPFRRVQAATSLACLVCHYKDPHFGEEWPRTKARLQDAAAAAAGTTDGVEVAQELGRVNRYLLRAGRTEEAVQLTSWAVQTFGERGDIAEVFFALCDNAVALHFAEKHEEAAMVLESLHQRATDFARPEAARWAVAYLRDFAEGDTHSAYADTLARLSSD